MGDAVQNDTYGEMSRAELAEMRANAKRCLTCGMLATVDPVAHESRYGHAPTITDGPMQLTWSTSTLSWMAERPATGKRYDVTGVTVGRDYVPLAASMPLEDANQLAAQYSTTAGFSAVQVKHDRSRLIVSTYVNGERQPS